MFKNLQIKYLRVKKLHGRDVLFVQYCGAHHCLQILTRGKVDIREFFLKHGWRLNKYNQKTMARYGVPYSRALAYHRRLKYPVFYSSGF